MIQLLPAPRTTLEKLKSSKIAGTLALGSSEIGKFPKDSETLFLEFVIAVFSNQIDKILPSTNE